MARRKIPKSSKGYVSKLRRPKGNGKKSHQWRPPVLRPGKKQYIKKVITRRSGHQADVTRTTARFQKPVSVAKRFRKRDLDSILDKHLIPKFNAYYRKQKQKGKTVFYFRTTFNLNYRGARHKMGISTEGVKITTPRGFKMAMDDLKAKVFERFKKYLKRKMANSITVNGYSVEALREKRVPARSKTLNKNSRRRLEK